MHIKWLVCLVLLCFCSEKTEIFLEVFGNSEIRSQTQEILRQAASQLSLSVTETLEAPTHDCLDTTLLKVQQSVYLSKTSYYLYDMIKGRCQSHPRKTRLELMCIMNCKIIQSLLNTPNPLSTV